MNALDVDFKEACDFYDRELYDLALPIFSRLADAGHASAQNNLGAMYEGGVGVGASADKALYWYKRAIKNGSEASIYNVGDLYRKIGKIALAKKWFEKAAVLGDGESSVELAKIYLSGRVTESVLCKVRSLLDTAIDISKSTPETSEEARKIILSLKD